MPANLERAANTAVFEKQMNSMDAIRFISFTAQVDRETAEAALKSVVTFHKSK